MSDEHTSEEMTISFFKDPLRWIEDLHHCCSFLMLPEVQEIIRNFDAELVANAKRVQFTAEEQTKWDGIKDAILAEEGPYSLMKHGDTVVRFLSRYQKS